MYEYPDDIEESNALFIAAWRANSACMGRIESTELPGIAIAYTGSPIAVLNMTFPSSPMTDLADVKARAERAIAYGAARRLPWLYSVCREWLPEGEGERADEVLAELGLRPAMTLTGMVADEGLLPPRRPEPDGLEVRRVADRDAVRAAGAINAVAYDIPLDVADPWMGRPMLYIGDRKAYVGYAGGAPVTTATAFPLLGRLYVAFVATDAAHRGRGYAEEVMRAALEDGRRATGYVRSVLHASPAGRPLYLEMGYREVAEFTWYSGPLP